LPIDNGRKSNTFAGKRQLSDICRDLISSAHPPCFLHWLSLIWIIPWSWQSRRCTVVPRYYSPPALPIDALWSVPPVSLPRPVRPALIHADWPPLNILGHYQMMARRDVACNVSTIYLVRKARSCERITNAIVGATAGRPFISSESYSPPQGVTVIGGAVRDPLLRVIRGWLAGLENDPSTKIVGE
jgi:hypothetical protein